MNQTVKRIDANKISEPLSEEVRQTERTMPGHAFGRNNMREWLKLREQNSYLRNKDFQHTVRYYLGEDATAAIEQDLIDFGALIPTELDAAVAENDFRFNNPRIDSYDGIGDRINKVVHHPDYTRAGDIIYGTGMVEKLTTLGGMREGMSFYFLSNHVGEAGHHCPIICNYETARLLRLIDDFPEREEYINKLLEPSYTHNYTSSQFLTEVQGGSDLGANDTRAWQDEDGNWFIRGEKWFCSNANAELMVISARHDTEKAGTKGLSVFLIPSTLPDGSPNHFTMRRLKEKMGTKALASAEIDYHDAYAIPLGNAETGFNVMMENVVHHSRISLAVAVLGFVSRAYQLSHDFATTRHAFGKTILQYPLVRQNLAHIKADLTASLAGTFALVALQDDIDTGKTDDAQETAFARLMTNIGKSVISQRAVDHVHHALDGIGGNGAIETTSSMPRLLRDVVIFENWEGTHNTLYMQILRDFARYQHDQAYLAVMKKRIAGMQSSKNKAEAALAALAQDMEAYKVLPHDLKTIKIPHIVKAMANLFYFVEAVKEGDHQLAMDGDRSKLSAAELFHDYYIMKRRDACDEEYLSLCRDIISA